VILTGGAWLLFGALLYSLGHSPDAGHACHPDSLWAGGWFFLPPILATATLFAARRRVALIGSGVLLALWLLILPIWFLLAITHGASCGGG
jgi:hypothetical protein